MFLPYLVSKDLLLMKTVPDSSSRYLLHVLGILGSNSHWISCICMCLYAYSQSRGSLAAIPRELSAPWAGGWGNKEASPHIWGGDFVAVKFNDIWDFILEAFSYSQKWPPKYPLSGEYPDNPLAFTYFLIFLNLYFIFNFLALNHIELQIEQEEASKVTPLARMFLSETRWKHYLPFGGSAFGSIQVLLNCNTDHVSLLFSW